MKVNKQFQDRHLSYSNTDWVKVQEIERDICLLYHQLSDYSYIMGDLYWGSVYQLPYWEYLDLQWLDDEKRIFIRDGCLVMILTMLWEMLDDAGSFIEPNLKVCQEAVSQLKMEDSKSTTLLKAVKMALDCAVSNTSIPKELSELSIWVHREYVMGYFQKMAEEFDENLYDGNV